MNSKTLSRAFILLAALAVGACSNPDPDPDPGNPNNPGSTACANAACDANATCDASSGQAVCTCKAGYSGDGKTCADVNECATAGSCSANATCTNTPGSFTCACRPGYSGDGRTCTASSTGRVLVFADGAGAPATPPAAAAAASLGMTFTVTTTEAGFVEAFDRGGFEVVMVDSETVPLPANVQSRLTSWVSGTGKVIIAHAGLHQLPALQDLLAVDAANPPTSWRNLYVAPNVAPNLFEQGLSLPSPLTATASSFGLELTPRGTGVKLAAFGSTTGSGAMAVTLGQRAIVHGFRTADVAPVDKDTDGVPDIQELYANELIYLLNPRVLVYDDNPAGPRLAAKAVNQLKMTALITSDATQFQAASARGGYQILLVDCTSDRLPTEVMDKVTSWVSANNPLLFSYWDLDSEENFAFDVLHVVVTSFNYSRPIHRAPTSPQNFFSLRETLPSPIMGIDLNFDKGDELTLGRPGFIAARFDSATGPGAIAVTHGGKVIINGFISYEMEPDDEDGDGKPDIQELFLNQLVYLGAP